MYETYLSLQDQRVNEWIMLRFLLYSTEVNFSLKDMHSFVGNCGHLFNGDEAAGS